VRWADHLFRNNEKIRDNVAFMGFHSASFGRLECANLMDAGQRTPLKMFQDNITFKTPPKPKFCEHCRRLAADGKNAWYAFGAAKSTILMYTKEKTLFRVFPEGFAVPNCEDKIKQMEDFELILKKLAKMTGDGQKEIWTSTYDKFAGRNYCGRDSLTGDKFEAHDVEGCEKTCNKIVGCTGFWAHKPSYENTIHCKFKSGDPEIIKERMYSAEEDGFLYVRILELVDSSVPDAAVNLSDMQSLFLTDSTHQEKQDENNPDDANRSLIPHSARIGPKTDFKTEKETPPFSLKAAFTTRRIAAAETQFSFSIFRVPIGLFSIYVFAIVVFFIMRDRKRRQRKQRAVAIQLPPEMREMEELTEKIGPGRRPSMTEWMSTEKNPLLGPDDKYEEADYYGAEEDDSGIFIPMQHSPGPRSMNMREKNPPPLLGDEGGEECREEREREYDDEYDDEASSFWKQYPSDKEQV